MKFKEALKPTRRHEVPAARRHRPCQDDGRSLRVTFDSQEVLTPEQMAELFALYERVGWFFLLQDRRREGRRRDAA